MLLPRGAVTTRCCYHEVLLPRGAVTMRCCYHEVLLPRGAVTTRCCYNEVLLPRGAVTTRCCYHEVLLLRCSAKNHSKSRLRRLETRGPYIVNIVGQLLPRGAVTSFHEVLFMSPRGAACAQHYTVTIKKV